MVLSRPALSLDVVRAGLGCLLVLLQARSALDAHLLGRGRYSLGAGFIVARDWGFSAAVACHIGWLFSSAFRSRCTKYSCCASRVVPKLGLVAQLIAEQSIPATASWFNEACWKRWYWRAMAEAFVYSCGEFPAFMLVPAAVIDIFCTSVVWVTVHSLTGKRPSWAGAAYVLLRLSLAAFLHHCQLRDNLNWLRHLASAWFPQPHVTKAEIISYDVLSSNTPVYSSMLCCNNPTMLSKIAAASGKDLEPVRLERLSEEPQMQMPAAVPAVGGTEAYDLARRLVSSAGGSGTSSGATGSCYGSYTSAARKVRVSVKIPDRSPEELPAGWESDLRVNGRREAALVLFTYIRRGCVQLILDFFGNASPAATAGGTAADASLAEAPAAASRSGPSGTVSPSQVTSSVIISGVDSPGVCQCSGQEATQPVEDAGGGRGCGGIHTLAMRERLLHAISVEGMLADRTITVQVGSNVSQLHVRPANAVPPEGASADSSRELLLQLLSDAGPALSLPPDVAVWPQVICTAGGDRGVQGRLGAMAGLRRLRQRQPLQYQRQQPTGVVVACSWHADKSFKSGASTESPPGDLQMTARQQGRFLPVALVGPTGQHGSGARAYQEQLAEGAVTAAVNGCQQGASAAGPSAHVGELGREQWGQGGPAPGPRACHLAFAPARREGLVQIELSRDGLHSAAAAIVLLLPSRAAASELQQLQVAAASNRGPTCALVQDVLRDFGTFLDISYALAQHSAEGAAPAGAGPAAAEDACRASPLIAWSLPEPCVPGASPVPTHILLNAAGQIFRAAHAGSGNADTRPEDTAVDQWGAHQRQEHVRGLATIGSRIGFSLLRYFLSSGLGSCAVHVLDALQERFSMPAALVAGYTCPEGMTLLHHAACSGAFGSVAALAGWLEVRGVALGWSARCPAGLTPLHLVAVAPGGDATAVLVQVRWPAARAAWHRRGGQQPQGDCDASPVEFAAMARGPEASAGCNRAANAAVALGAGTAWRCVAALRRHAVPHDVVRSGWEFMAPSLGFVLPSLESAYVSWLTRRAAVADHAFLALYTAYCISQACKGGWSFFKGHAVGLVVLTLRLGFLVVYSPCWSYVVSAQRRLLPWLRSSAPAAVAGPSSEGFAQGAGKSADPRPVGEGHLWSLASREGRFVVLEALRSLLMLGLAARVMPTPDSWRLLVLLHLDLLYNIVMRPMALQLRVESSIVASAIALVGEASVTSLVIWKPADKLTALLYTVLAFARGIATHTLGLCFTVMIQASTRKRFLAAERERSLVGEACKVASRART